MENHSRSWWKVEENTKLGSRTVGTRSPLLACTTTRVSAMRKTLILIYPRVLPWEEKRRSSSFTRANRWRSHVAICRTRRGCNLIGCVCLAAACKVCWWHLYLIVPLRRIRKRIYLFFSPFHCLFPWFYRWALNSRSPRICIFSSKRIKLFV